MSDTVFCFTCRKLHPREVVVMVQSKGVTRWRCLRSIIESGRSRDQRDALARSVIGLNHRSTGLRTAMQSLLRPLLELFSGAPGRLEERL